VLGGVKIGSGITIDGNGVISASSGYTLPSATTSTLGGVIVGAGLSVSSGTVSANLTSVAGRTGAVTLSKSDVGLGNVDNTSDASKPVSTAMQNALDGKAAASHTHTIANVTGLQTALDGKQASGSYASATHGHSISDVTGLQTALDGKQAAGSYAAATHGHAIGDVTGLQTALDGKAATSHTHSADAITSGTIATARLGSGAASASNFLRGDGTWATAGSSSASDLTSGTLSNARLTSRARAAVNVSNWSSFR
jgi:hypothetical protein